MVTSDSRKAVPPQLWKFSGNVVGDATVPEFVIETGFGQRRVKLNASVMLVGSVRGCSSRSGGGVGAAVSASGKTRRKAANT